LPRKLQYIAGSTFAVTQKDSFSVSIGADNEHFISDDHFIDRHDMKRLACGFEIFGDGIIRREIEIRGGSSFASCAFLSTISFESQPSLIQIESDTLSAGPDRVIADKFVGRLGIKKCSEISISVSRFGLGIWEPRLWRLCIRAGKQNPVRRYLVHV
jgi:hypothetical protein